MILAQNWLKTAKSSGHCSFKIHHLNLFTSSQEVWLNKFTKTKMAALFKLWFGLLAVYVFRVVSGFDFGSIWWNSNLAYRWLPWTTWICFQFNLPNTKKLIKISSPDLKSSTPVYKEYYTKTRLLIKNCFGPKKLTCQQTLCWNLPWSAFKFVSLTGLITGSNKKHRTQDPKRNEIRLSLQTSSSHILLTLGKLYFFCYLDLPKPLPIEQVRKKK